MHLLKSILDDFFKKQKLDLTLKGYHVFDLWEGAVGPRIARHTQPKKFRDRILWVMVDNSVWMQELTFLERKIKEELNQMIGSPLIEKIRFQLGEIHSSRHEIAKSQDQPEWQKIEVDDTVRENIEKEVALLNDEGLKARLKSLFRKHAQLKTFYERE